MKSDLKLSTISIYQKMLQYKQDRLKREKALEKQIDQDILRQAEIAQMNETQASAERFRQKRDLALENMREAQVKRLKDLEEVQRFNREVVQMQEEYSKAEAIREQKYRQKYRNIQHVQEIRQQKFQEMFLKPSSKKINLFYTEKRPVDFRSNTPLISKTRVREHSFDPVTGAIKQYKRNLTPQRSLGNIRREHPTGKISEIPFNPVNYELPKKCKRAVSFNPLTHTEIFYN